MALLNLDVRYSVYDVAQKKYITLWTKFTRLFVRKQIIRQFPEQDISSVWVTQQWAPVSLVIARCQCETPCRRYFILLIGDFVPVKLVELTPCGHRSEKKTAFLQLRSKNKICNNAKNWGNLIRKQKNKRKKCSRQLSKNPFQANAAVRNAKQTKQWVKGSYFSNANYPLRIICKLSQNFLWRLTALTHGFHWFLVQGNRKSGRNVITTNHP
jgi:hypothetical protein